MMMIVMMLINVLIIWLYAGSWVDATVYLNRSLNSYNALSTAGSSITWSLLRYRMISLQACMIMF